MTIVRPQKAKSLFIYFPFYLPETLFYLSFAWSFTGSRMPDCLNWTTLYLFRIGRYNIPLPLVSLYLSLLCISCGVGPARQIHIFTPVCLQYGDTQHHQHQQRYKTYHQLCLSFFMLLNFPTFILLFPQCDPEGVGRTHFSSICSEKPSIYLNDELNTKLEVKEKLSHFKTDRCKLTFSMLPTEKSNTTQGGGFGLAQDMAAALLLCVGCGLLIVDDGLYLYLCLCETRYALVEWK